MHDLPDRHLRWIGINTYSTCPLCSDTGDTGQFDDDRDPTNKNYTMCILYTNVCIHTCAAGFQDDDCNDATRARRVTV